MSGNEELRKQSKITYLHKKTKIIFFLSIRIYSLKKISMVIITKIYNKYYNIETFKHPGGDDAI